MTMTHFRAAGLFWVLLSIVAASCEPDESDDTRPLKQQECQLRCEEEFAADLAHPDCVACTVTCNLADNAMSYTCVFDTCVAERCTEHCQPTEYPVGLCNHPSDEGIYWGCNCFALE